jgi:hypothetical protein
VNVYVERQPTSERPVKAAAAGATAAATGQSESLFAQASTATIITPLADPNTGQSEVQHLLQTLVQGAMVVKLVGVPVQHQQQTIMSSASLPHDVSKCQQSI